MITFQILSDEEKRIVHNDSIRILEQTGIRFASEKALTLLEAGGAKIDRDRKIAFISEDMVKSALAAAPKEFTLGARNPKFDFKMPSDHTTFTVDGTGVNVLDSETGEKRGGTLKDIGNTAKVYEEIDYGMIYWPPIEPLDIPAPSRYLCGVGVSFINGSKHIQGEVREVAEVTYTMEMAKAILGSEKEVIERKIYSGSYCTVAPLTHDQNMLEANMEFTKFKAPILIYPMPACGTTGPASLCTNLAVANAEALSAIVIFQLTTPGTPLIFGSAQGVVNRRSGMFLEAAPETIIQLTAMGEMGKYYGLPTTMAGCLSDAKMPGMQANMEKTMSAMPLVLAGLDAVQGIGMVESSMTLSFEQMLIDGEIAAMCNRIARGIDFSEDRRLVEDVEEVKPGGHYLTRKSTAKLFRSSEYYTPSQIVDRGTYNDWLALGRPDMFSEAHKKVESILADDVKHPLEHNAEKVIKEIMDEATAKLCE